VRCAREAGSREIGYGKEKREGKEKTSNFPKSGENYQRIGGDPLPKKLQEGGGQSQQNIREMPNSRKGGICLLVGEPTGETREQIQEVIGLL